MDILLTKRKKQLVVCFLLLAVVGGTVAGPLGAQTALGQTGGDLLDSISKTDSGTSFWSDPIGASLSFFAELIFDIASAFVAVAGILLDKAIQFSVHTDNLRLPGIQTGWEVFRDLANMIFIFILLYIALATILQLSNFNTKRILITLIVIALLVNFSFFLAGIVIDASNILALFLYNSITANTDSNGNILRDTNGNIERTELGDIFISRLQLTTLKDDGTIKSLNHREQALVYFMGSIMLFVTAFVFLAGAIMFVLRTVVLMFVLVIAPIAFVAAILPKTQNHWNDWLGKLVNHSFVAPTYLLLISVVVLIMNNGNLLTAAGGKPYTLAAAWDLKNFETASGIVVTFILLTGLIIAAHTIASKMASGISRLSVKWAGAGIGLAAGGTALAYRQTAGRGFRRLRESGYLQKKIKSEKASRAGKWAARAALRTADYGARTTGDVRGKGKVAKTMRAITGIGVAGAALGGVGVEVRSGEATQRTADILAKEREKRREAYEERTGTGRVGRARTLEEEMGRIENERDSAEEKVQELENRGMAQTPEHEDALKKLSEATARLKHVEKNLKKVKRPKGLTAEDVEDIVKKYQKDT